MRILKKNIQRSVTSAGSLVRQRLCGMRGFFYEHKILTNNHRCGILAALHLLLHYAEPYRILLTEIHMTVPGPKTVLLLALAAGLSVSTVPCPAAGADPVILLYNERIPYLISANDTVIGLAGERVNRIFSKAGIPCRWEKFPSKRIMKILEANERQCCAPNWFKTQEREKFAKFSDCIYQDEPTIALALRSNSRFRSSMTLSELLSDRRISPLIKAGYSYGDGFDRLIREKNFSKTETTVENVEMVKMIRRGAADYMFIAPEEAETVISVCGFTRKEFIFVKLTDAQAGNKRYLLFSKNVDDEVIRKINRAIRELGYR